MPILNIADASVYIWALAPLHVITSYQRYGDIFLGSTIFIVVKQSLLYR